MNTVFKLTEVSNELDCAGVYMVTCVLNGKNYIGQTSSLYWRSKSHSRCISSNKRLKEEILKYGASKFIFQVIEFSTDKDILRQLESEYINNLKSYIPEYGYNIHRFMNRLLLTDDIKKRVNSKYPYGSRRKMERKIMHDNDCRRKSP